MRPPGEEKLRKVAKRKGLRLTEKLEKCDICGLIKFNAIPLIGWKLTIYRQFLSSDA